MAPELVSGTIKASTSTSSSSSAQNGVESRRSSISCAYVTFLAGNGDYVKGVVGLAKGLIKAKSMYPLVVAILPDVPEEHRQLLRRHGCIVREIEPLAPSLQSTSDKYARSYYVLNYSKLRIWQFVEFSKMVYLDGDMQVFDNIDHLFELPDKYFYAVADCICDMYGEPCPEVLPWPKELGPRPSIYFNAGMFVFQPNLSIYVRLLNTLKVTPPTQFAEQDFLNMFFKDMYKPIPYAYNLLLAMLWRHPEKIEVNKAKAVHYCSPGAKPWKYTGKEEHMDREDIKMLVKKWWDIYNDQTLDYKAQGSRVDPGQVEANRLMAAAFSDTNISTSLCVASPSAA
ncbi:galactinol synthase 1 [Capsicum chacoense]|uniref:Hexosyltransferase n=1 Tax=Capsicum annuum TaxID=4072 RepID=A0A1U8GZ91_CAPAN|nr:galactinol synthase 1 [Capsicum annuum]KAF3651579.1 Galactinol synthase 2 [Capsicum annuum]PHT63084.1 Galactinol synthase 2 [Capsicum annuum]